MKVLDFGIAKLAEAEVGNSFEIRRLNAAQSEAAGHDAIFV